jgi:phage terminase small subunit
VAINEKNKRFGDEYLIDFNATQAAIRAGYSKKTAYSIGQRLLKNVELQRYMKEKRDKIVSKLEISAERTLLEISRLAYQDVRMFYDEEGNLIPIHELSDEAAAVVAGMDIEEIKQEGITVGYLRKIKRFDKIKPLEMLGRYQGIFKEDNGQKEGVTVNQPMSDAQVDKIINSLRENKAT